MSSLKLAISARLLLLDWDYIPFHSLTAPVVYTDLILCNIFSIVHDEDDQTVDFWSRTDYLFLNLRQFIIWGILGRKNIENNASMIGLCINYH